MDYDKLKNAFLEEYKDLFEEYITKYDYFVNNVVKTPKKIQANDLVSIFMGVITDKTNYYLHPAKKHTLVTPNGDVAINDDRFKSFFSYFDRNYTPQEKNIFAEISDRLIEDTNRRNKGEFYTPTLFVDYSHKMMSEQFGEDWKDKYVVWDNCCGTKNLTRDYKFKELYCSTLENAELEISKRYNQEATSFQFDFLNDCLDKLPQGLKNALEGNKPIIFLINPPYATANNLQKDGSSKKGCAKTMVNQQMINEKIGACSQNLYAQFLYRIMKIKQQYGLTDCHIGLFSPTLFLSGGSWKGFRNVFFNEFAFNDAVQFKASHFADVADSWGISFSVWTNGVNADNHNFNYNLIDNVDGEIQIIGKKDVYNTDGLKTASDWIKEDIKELKTKDAPQLSSALVCKENGIGKLVDGALGYYVNVSNNVYKSQTDVYIVSSCSSMGHGCSILPKNFERVMANFASRKLIVGNWINDKDEYLAPNETNENYQEFVNDSIIYSLFHSSSNQSSLRNIEYKGKQWNIKNEFFFMGKDEVMELANTNNNDECYEDCRTDNDRYVYGLLNGGLTLSDEAKAVLDKAREITIKSFPYRQLFNEEHPEYQINNWDCGWYQIKALAKEHYQDDYNEFCNLYKKLADKMRPMVYELGFLK